MYVEGTGTPRLFRAALCGQVCHNKAFNSDCDVDFYIAVSLDSSDVY